MAESSKKRKLAVEGRGASISDLPDEVLENMLSFLSTRESVQTCVLSRRWRYLWKYAPAVRITGESIKNCRELLDHVILCRGRAPINTCDLDFIKYNDCELHSVNMWIFYSLSVCKVRELRVCAAEFEDNFLRIANLTIISEHLTRLDLDSVMLKAHTVDFSNCPALEELEMIFSTVHAKKIMSKSLKRLSLTTLSFEDLETDLDTRIRISVPSLLSLKLVDCMSWTPLFDSMPSLVDAIVIFDNTCDDHCDYNGPWDCGNEDCHGCYAIDDGEDGCLLLDRLSGATHLEFMSVPRTVCLHFLLLLALFFVLLQTAVYESTDSVISVFVYPSLNKTQTNCLYHYCYK